MGSANGKPRASQGSAPKNLNRGTKTLLIEAHFDPEDWNYVRTAAESESKILAAHDPDYSPKVCKIFKKWLLLTVDDAQGVCALIEDE